MANDEKPVEKVIMASSSVAITSKDSASSSLAILMASVESLPSEVREPLSGEASTSLSRGALPPSEGGASQETEGLFPAPMPATSRRRAAVRNNRIHWPSVVMRRAASELTGAVTRYKGVRPNKNSDDDDDNISNNNHAALAERFQSSALHKLRQLGIYTITDTPDNNDINNNNRAALAERFQPYTLHKLRQLGIYTITYTPDCNDINNNNHAALAERFQPSTLHKLRQLGIYTITDTDDSDINNKNHAALAERFQVSTLHKLRQLGFYAKKGHAGRQQHLQQQQRGSGGTFPVKYPAQAATTRHLHQHRHAGRQRYQLQQSRGSSGAFPAEYVAQAATTRCCYQLDGEAVPAEVAYTRSNTQPSCSGVGESDCVLQRGHDKLTLSYIVTLTDALTIFKVGLQGLTAPSTTEAELVAAALAMEDEAVFCSNTMSGLGFGESFASVPLHIDNPAALYIASNRIYIPRQSISAEVLLFRARTGGVQGQRPLRPERGLAGGLGHPALSLAPSPPPQRVHQRL